MSNQGKKFDDDKLPMSLISSRALFKLAKILKFGADRYGKWNWAEGLDYTRVSDALLRHLLAWLDGEDFDPDSGESHTYHVLCNAMFLAHYMSDPDKYEKFDDRPNTEKKEPCGWCGDVGEEKNTEAKSVTSQVAPVVAGIPVKLSLQYLSSCSFCGHLGHANQPGCTACDIIEAPGGPCSYKNQASPQCIE